MASYSSTTQEVHVLLVEHDPNHLISTMQLLEFFSYKAKSVDHSSTALSILSNGKAQFDVMMANINSLDTTTFKLIQEAVKMELIVILMCDYDDDMMARSALEQGAFLFLPKPIKMEDVKYLWQHVWREKTWKNKEKERIGVFNSSVLDGQIPLENITSDDDDVAENCSKSRKNVRTRKVLTQWTQQLHNKFVDAIIELGEGRCYPKEILELMNVPGLTRLQVASHLQKCRKGNWRPSKERKRHNSNTVVSPAIKATKLKRNNFGSMPVLTKHFEEQNLQINESGEKIQDGQIYSPKSNNVFDYHPQGESQKNLSGFTFSQDNVAEQDGTNLLTVPGAFMHNETFMFDFNSVTSGDLQAFDIDQPNLPGSSQRGTNSNNEEGP